MAIFRDREEAGRFLAEAMKDLKGKENTLILAIPRGGVIIGKTIAKELQLPLDIIVTRKIGAPGIPELAMGATTSEGGTLWNEDVLGVMEVREEIKRAAESFQIEAAIRAVRKNNADEVIVAIPVAPPETAARFRSQADRLVVLTTPEPFYAIG